VDVQAVLPILIVDDDPDTGPMLVELLSYTGIAAEYVRSSDEAVRLLARRPYALVLADYVFGSVEGALQNAESLLAAAHPVPVGVLSGWQLPARLRERMAFTLLKPASSEQLVENIAPFVTPQVEQPGRRDQIERYFAALGGQAWDELASLCSPDVVYHVPGDDRRFARTVTGRMAFRDYAQEVFSGFPGATFRVTAVTWLSYGAVVRYSGTWRAAQKDVEHTGVVMFSFDEQGRIARLGIRLDLGQLTALAG
jgi:ketosteroid isomerase-like protein/CheY-like chemotaxis protein